MRTLPRYCCVLLFLLVPLHVLADQQPLSRLPGMPLPTKYRRAGMRSDAQLSTAILVGTITDTTMAASNDGFVYTTFIASVDTLIVGPDDTLPTVRFRQIGGRVGNRTSGCSDCTKLFVGRRYVLSLYRCGEEQDYSLWDSSCIAEVVGSVAHPAGVRHTYSLTAFLDTLATYAGDRLPEYQRSLSDAVVTAYVNSVEYTDPRTRISHSPALVRATVDSVLWSRQDPRFALRTGTAQLTVHPQDSSVGRAGPATTHVVPNSRYVLFLQWREGAWALAPSPYSAWSIEGDEAIVRTHLGPCGPSSAIASIRWSTLISLLR